MKYLAVTESVASWLIGKSSLIDSLHRGFVSPGEALTQLSRDEFVEGPFHIAASSDESVVTIWNTDYLSGTGDEPWGFIRLSGAMGLVQHPEISREAFERALYVISQRLQILLIDAAFFPRTYPNGTHTCLAGRGSEARQSSLGYFETSVGTSSQKQQAIICVGPESNWKTIQEAAEAAGKLLPALVTKANQTIAPGRKVALATPSTLADVREFLSPFTNTGGKREFGEVQISISVSDIDGTSRHNAASLSYSDWLKANSSLTATQRRILLSDAINEHPIRVIGPGGSGKTLLMQLLCIRRLRESQQSGEPARLLYLVHNQAMAQTVRRRFQVLMSDNLLAADSEGTLEVKTLSQVAREMLELDDAHVIDTDAQEAKAFQLEQVRSAIHEELTATPILDTETKLLRAARASEDVQEILAILIMSDISIAIKGQGLARDKRKYVQSARYLSRFHGSLNEAERDFVFRVYERYHREVFETLEVLDSDDLAISLLGRIRTPIWDLRRRKQGFDYIFVDETQLFNENERRIIPLLANGLRKHVPVALALDEAQAIYAQASAGFGALGLEGITSESLGSIHRSTKAIVDLAFFVIQRSTDLFGPDFPDFTQIAEKIESDSHALAVKPKIDHVHEAKQELGKFVLKRVRELRRANVRQICVVVHADQYWETCVKELSASDLPLQLMLTRGLRVPTDQPIVVLTKPAYVGGQEFDATILVGLEQGIAPPKIGDNEALSIAIEQQLLREIYLSITRARYRVIVALSHGAAPTAVLADAVKHGLLLEG